MTKQLILMVLQYVQPRYFRRGPGNYDRNTIISEIKTKVIEAASVAEARKKSRAFLKNGAVRCSGNVCRRKRLTFEPVLLFGQRPVLPKPEVVPLYEVN